MQDNYKNIEYNSRIKWKVLIVFNDMIADKKLNLIVTELFITDRKAHILVAFIFFYYESPKEDRFSANCNKSLIRHWF